MFSPMAGGQAAVVAWPIHGPIILSPVVMGPLHVTSRALDLCQRLPPGDPRSIKP